MKRKNKYKSPVELKKNAEEVLRKTFGNKLKELREKNDISQETMAFIAGLSRSYYGEVETGKRNVSLINISKILLATNAEFNQLLSLNDLKKVAKPVK